MRPKKFSRFTLVFFSLLIFLCTAFADDKTDKVDKIFVSWNKSDTPGCAIAIIKDGNIIYKRGYGMADLENNVPITPQSVFYIGSVSKQFVAMCVALLVQEEQLSLDDDVREYIPELPDYGTPITIRHLIYHTSGIRDFHTLEVIASVPFGFFHEQDILNLIVRQKELNFPPGDEFLYSNSGYFLLGIIIHRITGKTLRQYAQDKIFKPLGMKSSRFHDDYTELIKNRASGYLPVEGRSYKNFISTFDLVGAGGLFTSVEDLFLWDQNFYHHKVGGKEAFDLLHTVGMLNDGTKLDYAFALNIKSYKGLKIVSHGGALWAYKSAFIRFPEHNFSIICLSNLSSFDPSSLSLRVADIYLSEFFAEEKEKPTKIQAVKLKNDILRRKTGLYIHVESGEKIRVSMKGRKLYITLQNKVYPLAPVSEFEFLVQDSPRKRSLRFEQQQSKKPQLLHIYEVGKKPRTYTSSKVLVPKNIKLSEYQGRFFSEELQATFEIRLEEGELHFVHKKVSQMPFKPLYMDFFQIGNMRIHFVRNKEKKITGFLLDADRVRNLRFTKLR